MVPVGSTDQEGNAKIILNESGEIQSIATFHAPNPAFKESIEATVRSAAPFDIRDHQDVKPKP